MQMSSPHLHHVLWVGSNTHSKERLQRGRLRRLDLCRVSEVSCQVTVAERGRVGPECRYLATVSRSHSPATSVSPRSSVPGSGPAPFCVPSSLTHRTMVTGSKASSPLLATQQTPQAAAEEEGAREGDQRQTGYPGLGFAQPSPFGSGRA